MAVSVALWACGEEGSARAPEPGVYHMDGAPWSATNLEIRPGGIFRWGGGACDVWIDGDQGRWNATGDRVEFLPPSGRKTFKWTVPLCPSASTSEVAQHCDQRIFGLDEDSFERLEVVAGSEQGTLVISGVGDRLGDQSSRWIPGGVCVMACDVVGPCDGPDLGPAYDR